MLILVFFGRAMFSFTLNFFAKKSKNSIFTTVEHLPLQRMATLKNERKLAVVAKETQKEPSRNGHSRNAPVSRIKEEHVTHVSEEIEGRDTEKMSQGFSRTESRIFGTLSKLDEFL